MICIIKLRNDFRSFFSLNAFQVSPYIVYKYINQPEKIKFGIVIRKKIGNAVRRNLIRRRIKHILRENLYCKNDQLSGMLLMICRDRIASADFAALQQDVSKTLEKIFNQ